MMGLKCDPIPDLTEEVIGWRTFKVQRGRLIAATRRFIYEAGPNQAHCLIERHLYLYAHSAGGRQHEAPEAHCNCGFYAWYDRSGTRHNYGTLPIVGVVACSGRILPSSRGMRAQKVRVIALAVNDRAIGPSWLTTKRLGRHYDCPVFSTPEALDRCIKEWIEKGIVHEMPAQFRQPSEEQAAVQRAQRYAHLEWRAREKMNQKRMMSSPPGRPIGPYFDPRTNTYHTATGIATSASYYHTWKRLHGKDLYGPDSK